MCQKHDTYRDGFSEGTVGGLHLLGRASIVGLLLNGILGLG